MRALGGSGDEVDLAAAYAVPRLPWLRANMVSTLDGAAAGSDGRSGTINNEPDHAVFAELRRQCDAVVVGAGTARAEGYRAGEVPLIVVSRSGRLPDALVGAGDVVLATTTAGAAASDHDGVWALGDDAVDLAELLRRAHQRGWTHLLTEGGPSLLADLLTAGLLDELCLTVVPRLEGGDAGRILSGAPIGVEARLESLLEVDGTLLTRWFVT